MALDWASLNKEESLENIKQSKAPIIAFMPGFLSNNREAYVLNMLEAGLKAGY